MPTANELKQRLDRAGEIPDPFERQMEALAVITACLSEIGVKPIAVGGVAVAFHTLGGYATRDIDVIMVSSQAVDAAMSGLGFAKEGRHWLRTDIDIAVEAPSSVLHGDMRHTVEVSVGDLSAWVVGAEDLIIDRLNALVHWDSQEDGRWARRLIDIHGDQLDWDYLRQKASEEKVADALAEMERDG